MSLKLSQIGQVAGRYSQLDSQDGQRFFKPLRDQNKVKLPVQDFDMPRDGFSVVHGIFWKPQVVNLLVDSSEVIEPLIVGSLQV